MTSVFLAGCRDDDDQCDCDEGEYCVRYGSDIAGESDTLECAPLPSACEATPTCEYLGTVDDEDSNIESSLMFCLEQGGCQAEGGVPEVVCPGG